MIRGQASQIVGAQMVNATTGAAFAGAVTVYVTVDGGTQAIGTVGSGVCTLEGNGLYTYTPSEAETDGAHIAFTFIGTGAVPATIQVYPISEAQQESLQTASGANAFTVLALIKEALEELGVYRAGGSLKDDDAALGLARYNRLLDRWNAQRQAVYASQKLTNTLTASLSPHTLGPSGTWTTSQRPVSIEWANLILTGGSEPIRRPIWIRDEAWYRARTVPTLETTIPTDLWYRPDWPNGSLFFYPVPSSTYEVELWVPRVLGGVVLADVFSMPPAYWEAHVLSLAEACARPFGVAVDPDLREDAAKARAIVFDANRVTPRLVTRDAGMPSSRGRGLRTFNYLDRSGV